jgi:hypothetical protein
MEVATNKQMIAKARKGSYFQGSRCFYSISLANLPPRFVLLSTRARFRSANKKKEESGKLLVVQLFYYSNESVLISAGCDVVLLFFR